MYEILEFINGVINFNLNLDQGGCSTTIGILSLGSVWLLVAAETVHGFAGSITAWIRFTCVEFFDSQPRQNFRLPGIEPQFLLLKLKESPLRPLILIILLPSITIYFFKYDE